MTFTMQKYRFKFIRGCPADEEQNCVVCNQQKAGKMNLAFDDSRSDNKIVQVCNDCGETEFMVGLSNYRAVKDKSVWKSQRIRA